MLTKYEIEEEEVKPKIKHPEPEFHYVPVSAQRNLNREMEVTWRSVTATQIPNPVWVDYSGVHDISTIEPIQYSPPTPYILEEPMEYLPF